MNIIIDHKHTIREIQEDFQRHFPYLKIEFYSRSHKAGEGSLHKYQIRPGLTITEAQDHPKEGLIHITPDMKVADIENLFEEIFKLHVQIFRWSGKVWIQTITTDHLTLAEHNQIALEMEKPVSEKDDVQDYQEQS